MVCIQTEYVHIDRKTEKTDRWSVYKLSTYRHRQTNRQPASQPDRQTDRWPVYKVRTDQSRYKQKVCIETKYEQTKVGTDSTGLCRNKVRTDQSRYRQYRSV